MEGEELLRRYAAGERDFSWVDSIDADEELRGVVLRDINLSGVDLLADFTDADLSGANLVGCTLDCYFDNTKLVGSNLFAADVELCSFEEAILDGANLRGIRGGEINFEDASFINADLSSPPPSDLTVRGTYLPQCRFDGVNFTNANLSGVDFSHSGFYGANFTGANLRDAIEFSNIGDAIFSNTIMPDGSIWYDSIGYKSPPTSFRRSR